MNISPMRMMNQNRNCNVNFRQFIIDPKSDKVSDDVVGKLVCDDKFYELVLYAERNNRDVYLKGDSGNYTVSVRDKREPNSEGKVVGQGNTPESLDTKSMMEEWDKIKPEKKPTITPIEMAQRYADYFNGKVLCYKW